MLKQLFDGMLSAFRIKRGPSTKRVGGPGVAVYSGYIYSGEDDAELQGVERWKTYANMLANISVVAAGVRYFLNLVSMPEWSVEPAEDSGPKGQEIADKVKKAIFKMDTPWHRVVRRAAMYRFYGYSWHEWTARQMDDGSIGYLDIEPRAQKTIERWDTDEHGKVHGVMQRIPQTMNEVYIPRAKSVYLVDDALHDSPEGLGLFRHMAEPCRKLTRYEKFEGWGYENDCGGMPVARAPLKELDAMNETTGLTATQKAAMTQPLKDFVNNHTQHPSRGLMLDSVTYATEDEKGNPSSVYKWDIDLLKSGVTTLGDLNTAIQRLTKDVARTMGFENLLLGDTGAGSLAMAKDKSHNAYLIVDSTVKDLKEGFNGDVIGPLMEMNGWPDELRPVLRVAKIQHHDIEKISGVLADMSTAGFQLMPEDLPIVNAILDLLGLPKIEEERVIQDAVDASLDDPKGKKEEVPEDPSKEDTEDINDQRNSEDEG